MKGGIDRLNAAPPADFVADLGAIYEHSPWVAAQAAALRPFASARALHDAMVACIRQAPEEAKLALIRAHPELAGQEASVGVLTEASTSEQGRLGFTALSRPEMERLADLNRRYRGKFGFPCVIALRLHQSRNSVLEEFERRLESGRPAEIDAALDQIGLIARGRLAQKLGIAGGRLTTHVLDTANGLPASGMSYALMVGAGAQWTRIVVGTTNAQGRTDYPLLSDIDMAPSRYRLEFAVGDYFQRRGAALDRPAFLDTVPIEFGIAASGQHYHVPLLCSPWSYSTYRGS